MDSKSMPKSPMIVAASRMLGQKPTCGPSEYATYAPNMKKDPWEKLITPIRPRMMFKPSATKMYSIPNVMPLKN